MKITKYITIAIVLVSMISCVDDDFTRKYVDNEIKTDLVGTVSVAATSKTNGEFNGKDVEISYTLPQSFSVESTLKVEVKSFYRVLPATPNVEFLFITVPSGTTTGTETFEMPNFGHEAPFGGISEFLSVSITGIALTQPDNGSIDDPYTMTSAPALLSLFQTNTTSSRYMSPDPNILKLSLDWKGPYELNDIDLYVYNNFGLFESAESGNRFEGDFFNNSPGEIHPDGDYIVEIAIWTSVDETPIPWELVLTHPDGSQDIYEGTVDPAMGYIDPVGFTQVTDGNGVRTFTTYPLSTATKNRFREARVVNKSKSNTFEE